MYIDILHDPRDTVRTKRPEKWTMLQHTGRFSSRIKEQRDNTGAYLMLSWPDSSWLLPVPSTEISIKERGFSNATDIIKYETEDTKRLSQNVFQEYFQQIWSCWKNCMVSQGDYFEGNII